jgi:heme-degrading monooxygenase HmoA
VIVRVSRARIKPGMEEEVFSRIRQMTVARRGVPVGQRGVVIARRVAEDARATEVVAITIWEDMDSMIAILGPDWQRAVSFPSFQEYVTDGQADHYETLAVNWEGLLSIAGLAGDGRAASASEPAEAPAEPAT